MSHSQSDQIEYDEHGSQLGQEFRLGIDVGGTNTDAVILDAQDRVIASTKTPTTPDVTAGIVQALQDVLTTSGLPASALRYAMLGTTHCTNAIVTRRELNTVGIIRLGAPATRAVEPLLTWPADLRQIVGAQHAILHGGHEYNGEPLSALNEQEIRQTAQQMKGQVQAVAVTGVFSPVNQEHELRTREILQAELGEEIPVSLSSEIGSVNLLERENATVLNAALIRVVHAAISGFQQAIRQLNIPATLFLGQNDGSLMSLEYALQYPIFTIASGPANSIRGAAALSQLGDEQDAIVVDIGGTTTDIGVLHKGFPRESQLAVEIGGVITNFRMPDLISVGLGGGSRVHITDEVRVGPDSGGYRLTQEATAFARERAKTAGADPDTVDILDLEEIPLAYLPGNAIRIKVKAVGSLKTV